MNIFNLIKKTPFLLALIIIILISIFNQKQYTRLRILIWNTPSLSLGNYLAISSGTGFILSYIVTSNLAKNKKTNLKYEIKYKENKEEGEFIQDTDFNNEKNNEISYDNNFIERDVKDPTPTINASFRIISKNSRKKETPQNNQFNSTRYSDESDNQYNEEEINYDDNYDVNQILSDWEDDSYRNW